MADNESKLVFNNPTDRPASYAESKNDVQGSNLVRLVEDPDIPKTIRFDEISLINDSPGDVQGGNNKMTELGLTFPVIRINDVILAMKNITHLSISMSGFIPTVSLGLAFEDATFISKNPPKDGDMLSFFVRTTTNAIQYLRDDFIITSCSTYKGSYSNTGNTIIISGKLFIPGFEAKKNTNAFIGTSKSVMKQVAKSYGIGFAFNDYDDTKDFQTWIQCKEPSDKFVSAVASHAWKDNTSFYKAWIDLYYNLCFSNVNKFLLSDENTEEVDITFATNVLNMYNQINVDTSVGNAEMLPKVLSNAIAFRGTPFYISRWNPINNSTILSMSNGYQTITRSFLHNQNIINKDISKCFVTLENIPAYDQSKTDKAILLRGRASYDASMNPELEQARVNYDFVNTYVREEWAGIQYVLNDDDEDVDAKNWAGNVHKNYNNAPYHNAQNFNELNKIYLEVTCQGLCLQIMKGERIPVIIFPENTLEQSKEDNFSKNDLPSDINRFYTGYYIVDSVEYDFIPAKEGDLSPFSTKFILKRREWPTPEAI